MRLRSIALLLAAAAMAAAPAMADDKSSRWIRVQSMPLGGSMVKGDNYYHGWIEIQGWDWDVEKAAKIDSFTVKQGVKPVSSSNGGEWVADVERPAGRSDNIYSYKVGRGGTAAGTSDVTMKRGTSPAPSPPSPPAGPVPIPYPNFPLDYDEGDTGTHATGGNRTLTVHGTRTEGPAGPDKFGRVKVKFAWDGCARGLRLPSIELRDARMLYVLEDLTVVDCSAGSATFAYTGLRSSAIR